MADSMNLPGGHMFAILAVLTAAVHFAFLGYLVAGGFLSWRWPATVWLHVAVVLWGLASLALGLPCPLTDLERFARAEAGLGELPSEGFIAHYITGAWYPADLAIAVQALVFAAVAVSWIGFSIRSRRRSVALPGR